MFLSFEDLNNMLRCKQCKNMSFFILPLKIFTVICTKCKKTKIMTSTDAS